MADPYQTMISCAEKMTVSGFINSLIAAINYISGGNVAINSTPDVVMSVMRSLSREYVLEIMMSSYPIVGRFHDEYYSRDDIHDNDYEIAPKIILRGIDGDVLVTRGDVFIITGCVADIVCLEATKAALQWYARTRNVTMRDAVLPVTPQEIADFIACLP